MWRTLKCVPLKNVTQHAFNNAKQQQCKNPYIKINGFKGYTLGKVDSKPCMHFHLGTKNKGLQSDMKNKDEKKLQMIFTKKIERLLHTY